MLSNKKNDNNLTINEVHHKKFLIAAGLSASFILEVIFLFSQNTTLMIFPFILCCFCFLVYHNEKITYNINGISFHDFLGKERFVSWDNVISVEITMEDPRLSRGASGRIVKIIYKSQRGRIESKRYGLDNYDGLFEFYAFSINQIS